MINTGDKIFQYTISSTLGSGGMGSVYLAHDAKLNRVVAIKFLHSEFHSQDEALKRFIREARAASALNHPNIITIYEVGEWNGSSFIAMEYVEGQSLRELIKSQKLRLSENLDIVIQVASALGAAHEKGIVHRDIKPENVMVRKDGYVKVLDFGLAKSTVREFFKADIDTPTHKMIQTNPGVVMGTVSYMSPEQTRGREIDTRSDIWSLGVVLYQMISGVRPFPGDSASDVIAAILTSTPSELSKLVPEVPLELDLLVRKSLRKNREERYQDVEDMLVDLRDIRRDLENKARSFGNGSGNTRNFDGPDTMEDTIDRNAVTQAISGVGTTHSISDMFFETFRQHPRGMTFTVVVLAIVAVLAAIALTNYIRTPGGTTFQSMRFSKLTSSGNLEGGQVAISPDGKYVAYAVREGADQSLWIKHIPTGGNLKLLGASPARFRGLSFHPDSGYVFYVISEPDGSSSVNRIPVFGGETRRVIGDAEGPISFSPTGERFVFIRDNRLMITANTDGSGPEHLGTANEGEVWWLPAWSPDGRTIASTVYSNKSSRVELFTVDVETKKVQNLPPVNWLRISGLTWGSGGSTLNLSGRDPETQLSQIWRVSLPGGAVERVTNDPGSYQGLSLTADGLAAVSIQENRVSNIWVSDEAKLDAPRKLTSDIGRDEGMSGVTWSSDGSIVYTTRVKGSQDIWSVNPDGSANTQLTFKSGSNFHPTVSPDGRTVVFTSDRSGSLDLWRMDRDGRNATRLTDLPENESQASFTPDGQWIVFQSSAGDGRSSIWKVPSGGGDPVQISPVGAASPRISPDGRLLACELVEQLGSAKKKVAVFPIDDQSAMKLYDFPAIVATAVYRWSNDGKSLVFLNRLADGFELWSQPLNGGVAKRVAGSSGDRIFAFDISRNGRGVVFSRGTESSDAILINGIR